MSTNSRIGIKVAENAIVSVYHHWDGYPEWLGKVLTEQYNNIESVTELIDGGDMSSCWSDNVYDYEKQEFVKRDPRPEYYADRGEDCPPKMAESMTEYLDQCDNCGAEFAYVFDKGEWFCYVADDYNGNKGTLIDMEERFAKMEDS